MALIFDSMRPIITDNDRPTDETQWWHRGCEAHTHFPMDSRWEAPAEHCGAGASVVVTIHGKLYPYCTEHAKELLDLNEALSH